jgi:hypothetical protein
MRATTIAAVFNDNVVLAKVIVIVMMTVLGTYFADLIIAHGASGMTVATTHQKNKLWKSLWPG